MEKTLGIFETIGFAAALSAAEEILSNNKIEIIKIINSGNGRISQFYVGEYSVLENAFDEGVKRARDIGEITAVYIMKNRNKSIDKLLFNSDMLVGESASQAAEKNEGKRRRSNESKKSREFFNDKDFNAKLTEPNLFEKQKTLGKAKSKKERDSISSSTIIRLREEALSAIKSKSKSSTSSDSANNPPAINLSKLSELNVHELRHEARKFKSFPIQGRQISRANRKELLKYFEEMV